MTREEAIKWFRESPFYHKNHVPFNMAIKALEQEPCEDAISRKDIYFKLTNGAYPNETIEQFIDRLVKELDTLPLCHCGAKMVESRESDLGDYPDAIHDQFDNMTGSMNL